jgi:hypothetical protein
MSRFRRLHLTMLVIILAILTEPCGEAAQARLTSKPSLERASSAISSEILTQFWNQIADMLTKTGFSFDPNGRPGAPSVPASLDTGCSLDPHGGCTTAGH